MVDRNRVRRIKIRKLETRRIKVAASFIGVLMLAWLTDLETANGQRKRGDEGPYPVDPASVRQSDVPQGKMVKRVFSSSSIFPGTEREYAIYVPQQYDAAKPACLMVVQDGMRLASEKGASKIPIVFDNLIHANEMPVTIGVFVNPGVVPAQNENAQPRFNRSFEYDSIDNRYVDFLLSEILPAVEKDYSISSDPNDRAICGSSSGGIAAFNVAWQRPDQFRRVYTMVGTYIGLRGANEMSVLVRKTEPKPLRVFLQDGSNDLNIYCGDWWVANQGMLSALKFSGYEVDHVWGEGYHGQKHGGAIFPDAMRTIWKDWPKKVSTHFDTSHSRAPEMLLPDEGWELVSEGHQSTCGATSDADGNLYFADADEGVVFRVTADGTKSIVWNVNRWTENKRLSKPLTSPMISSLAIGADGSLYGCLPCLESVVKFNVDESNGDSMEFETIASTVKCSGIVAANDGTIYFTVPETKSVWMTQAGQKPVVAGTGFSGANGITLSPDQTLIQVSDFDGRYVWSSVRKAGGKLTHIQPYFHMHSPPAAVDVRPMSDGMCSDQAGWLLVATKMGIQICDQPGRVNLIVSPPIEASRPTSVSFVGPGDSTIFATFGTAVYKRKTKLTAAMPWSAPIKPTKPRL